MHTYDAQQYSTNWNELNRELNQIAVHGLGAALNALRDQQLKQGFIRDDLKGLQRYIFRHPNDAERYFAVQYNPARAHRFAGSGVTAPPPGAIRVHDGCFLCQENIQWQQKGIEIGFDIPLNGRGYIAWMNPYPLLPAHAVIASREHVAQGWRHNGAGVAGKGLPMLVQDLVDLAQRLPGWIGFYNGQGAGASIPHHFHYQFFRRPENYGLFPLELAARRNQNGNGGEPYPLAFAHWRGDPDTVVSIATRWIENWIATPHPAVTALTANLIAIMDGDGQIDVYFVPRDQARSRSAEMSGLIGGLEVLGELVFSSDDEKQRLDAGDVDYDTVTRVLSCVSVPLE